MLLFAGLLATPFLAITLHAQQDDSTASTTTTSTTPTSSMGRPQPSSTVTGATETQAHGELILVLPFDNTSANPSIDWIGSAFPEVLDRRFSSAGFLPIRREDRAYALEHLGLPTDFRPTRASTLRLAQTLDADFVIFGSYQVVGNTLTASARILDIANLRESAPLSQSADLAKLTDVVNTLAWQLTKQLDPTYSVAEQTFLAADPDLRLDAFEAYIRGISQGSAADRLQHLREAVQLDPAYGPSWLALGDAYFAAQNYDQAALAYGHLKSNDADALEADFHRGLAYFYTGKYLPAEDAFAFVTTRLPLPEAVNDEGVAATRRGKDGAPLFQQAITEDPRDADYHFNLALAYARRNDAPNALKEAQAALALRPSDTEIQAFANNLRNPGFLKATDPDPSASTPTNGPGTPQQLPTNPAVSPAINPNLPLERIKRTYNEAAFRQAAFEMEQLETLHAATEPRSTQLAALLTSGRHYLNAGLLVESEREYNRALAMDPRSADAYTGLARIRERTGDRAAAAQLANRSIQLHDTPGAHLVLARLALLNNQVPQAANEVATALRLNPADAEALGLRQAVVARGGTIP